MTLPDSDLCQAHVIALVTIPGADTDPASPALHAFRQCPACQAEFVAALDAQDQINR